MATEQSKSDIHYKNMNPKLSMKTGFKHRPSGSGSLATESKKGSAGQPASLSKKSHASAMPLHGHATRMEDRVKSSSTKGFKKLALQQHAKAKGNPAHTKPTWNTRKGAKKARRYA